MAAGPSLATSRKQMRSYYSETILGRRGVLYKYLWNYDVIDPDRSNSESQMRLPRWNGKWHENGYITLTTDVDSLTGTKAMLK